MKKIIFLIVLFFSVSFYGQNDTLSVVRHTDNDVVIPKSLKVLYRGIENELFIDVPGCKSFKVHGDGIISKQKNIYTVSPGAGKSTLISIDIVLKNNKKVTEKHFFRIKNIGSILATFNSREEQPLQLPKSNFKDGVVAVKCSDKHIEQVFEVTQFTIKIPGMGAVVIQGNRIDDTTFKQLNRRVTRYDEIAIFEIKIRSISSKIRFFCVRPAPMIIQVL